MGLVGGSAVLSAVRPPPRTPSQSPRPPPGPRPLGFCSAASVRRPSSHPCVSPGSGVGPATPGPASCCGSLCLPRAERASYARASSPARSDLRGEDAPPPIPPSVVEFLSCEACSLRAAIVQEGPSLRETDKAALPPLPPFGCGLAFPFCLLLCPRPGGRALLTDTPGTGRAAVRVPAPAHPSSVVLLQVHVPQRGAPGRAGGPCRGEFRFVMESRAGAGCGAEE